MHNSTGYLDLMLISIARCLATTALLLPATQSSPVANTEKLPKTIVHPTN